MESSLNHKVLEQDYLIKRLVEKNGIGGHYQIKEKSTGNSLSLFRFFDSKGQFTSIKKPQSFKKLAKKLSLLKCPHIPSKLTLSYDSDGPYLLNQNLTDNHLLSWIHQKGPLNTEQITSLARQLLISLNQAHRKGIYHTCLTPQYIYFPSNNPNHCLLSGLGLYQILQTLQLPINSLHSQIDLAFLPPELLEQHCPAPKPPFSPALELYLLGQTLFYSYVGSHPFAGETKKDLITLHQTGMPSILDLRPHLHPQLCAWIDSLVESTPSKRPSSISAALKSFDELQLTEPINPRSKKVLPSLLLGVLITFLLVLILVFR